MKFKAIILSFILMFSISLYAEKNPVVLMKTSMGDIEIEQAGQFSGRFPGAGIAPGAEGGQLPALFVKGQVAVHHRGYADAGQFTRHQAIALL